MLARAGALLLMTFITGKMSSELNGLCKRGLCSQLSGVRPPWTTRLGPGQQRRHCCLSHWFPATALHTVSCTFFFLLLALLSDCEWGVDVDSDGGGVLRQVCGARGGRLPVLHTHRGDVSREAEKGLVRRDARHLFPGDVMATIRELLLAPEPPPCIAHSKRAYGESRSTRAATRASRRLVRSALTGPQGFVFFGIKGVRPSFHSGPNTPLACFEF